MASPQRIVNKVAVPTPAAELAVASPAPMFLIDAEHGLLSMPGFREAWEKRELLYFLTLRDLKLRYKQTALGMVWTLLQPLITTGIFSVVFGKFAHLDSNGVPYPLFCFSALLAWNYFAATLSRCTNSFLSASYLLNKIYVPRLLVPLSALLPGLVDLAIGFGVWILLALFFHQAPSLGIFWKLPLAMGINLLFVFGLGTLLGSLNVRYRDIANLLPFLVQTWMFLTPVIYPVTMVSQNFRRIYSLNPLVAVVDGFRSALLGTPLDAMALVKAGAVAVFTVVFGLYVFSRMEKKFADLL